MWKVIKTKKYSVPEDCVRKIWCMKHWCSTTNLDQIQVYHLHWVIGVITGHLWPVWVSAAWFHQDHTGRKASSSRRPFWSTVLDTRISVYERYCRTDVTLHNQSIKTKWRNSTYRTAWRTSPPLDIENIWINLWPNLANSSTTSPGELIFSWTPKHLSLTSRHMASSQGTPPHLYHNWKDSSMTFTTW